MMELKGKKVLVVGLGKSGLAAALFLRRRGAQVTVSDVRSAEALAKEIPALLDEGIMVEAGGHGLLTFRRQDLIVVSPGVPLEHAGAGTGEELWAAGDWRTGAGGAFSEGEHSGNYRVERKDHDHRAAGRDSGQGRNADAGGRKHRRTGGGADRSEHRGELGGAGSFELPAGDDRQFHPRIAVILNITPDHLDRHGSFENYALAKERIFAAQDGQDFLVLNADNARAAEAAQRTKANVYWFSLERAGGAGRV